MGIKDNIEKKAKEIRDTAFDTKDISYVPSIDTRHPGLTFGCTGVKLPVSVLYIDMRGSCAVLEKHNRNVVAKIHMTYYHAIVSVANSEGGHVRSFNGDSLLVFFYGNDVDTVRTAVRTAFKMCYALKDLVNPNLKDYTDIDFGIGVDCGDVIATKVGIGGSNDNKDLVWIGRPVNFATRISDACKNPNHVGISTSVYQKLDESLLHYKETIERWGMKETYTRDVWSRGSAIYNGEYKTIYNSTCWYKIL